jgi:mono/diheme cytochrome c family protein
MSNPKNPTRRVALFLILSILAVSALVGCGPSEDKTSGSTGAATGGAATAAGNPTFATNCQGCHGDKGQGARGGPSLMGAKSKGAVDLKATIENGKRKMPSFKGKLSEEQINSLVSYIQSMS